VITNACVVATQWATFWMLITVCAVRSLNPLTGAAVNECIEKFWFSNDDLCDFTVYDFGEV